MEEHLRLVGASKECASDEALALQVRLQLLIQRALQAREEETEQSTTKTVSPAFYLKAFQSELQTIKDAISPRMQQHGELHASYQLEVLPQDET
jgi:hypothetical protein